MRIFTAIYYAIVCAALMIGAWFQTETGPAVAYGAASVMGYIAYRRELDTWKDA